MLDKLISVSKTGSIKDAGIFYIMATILLVGFSTTLVHVLGMTGVIEGGVGHFFAGGEMHTLIGTGFVLVLSSLILSGKKLTGDLYSILLAGVGIYLAFTSSVLLGLVPVAVLTMMKSGK